MDILSSVLEASKEADSFSNHPGKNLSVDGKNHYLNAVSIMASVDDDIHAEEKEYLRILIKSFDLDEELLSDYINFAQKPDKDSIQDFIAEFKNKDINQLLLFDALMLSRRDGKVDDKETQLWQHYARQFQVTEGQEKEIYDLFCAITNKKWNDSRTFYAKNPVHVKYFQHLLDFYEIRLDDILKFKNKNFIDLSDYEWCDGSYDGGRYNKFYLATTPVKNVHFLQFLEKALSNDEIKVIDQVVSDKTGKQLIFLDESKIVFNPESQTFFCEDSQSSEFVSGYTPLGALAMAKSLNCTVASSIDLDYNSNFAPAPGIDTEELLYHHGDEKFYMLKTSGGFRKSTESTAKEKPILKTPFRLQKKA